MSELSRLERRAERLGFEHRLRPSTCYQYILPYDQCCGVDLLVLLTCQWRVKMFATLKKICTRGLALNAREFIIQPFSKLTTSAPPDTPGGSLSGSYSKVQVTKTYTKSTLGYRHTSVVSSLCTVYR